MFESAMRAHFSFCRLFNTPNTKNTRFLSTVTTKSASPKTGEELTELSFNAEIRSDPTLFSHLLKTCVLRKSIPLGKQLHALAITSGYLNRFISNQILNMYSKLGQLQTAVTLFDHIPNRNTMSCNIMINAYVQSGDLENAGKVFDKMTERNVASWNAMIAGSVGSELNSNGLELFSEMHRSAFTPDEFGLASVLRGCAGLRAVLFGKQVHCCVVKLGFETDLVVASSLSHMYMNSAAIEEGERAIDSAPARNVVAWNTLIAGKAQSGRPREALDDYDVMKLAGSRPDGITLVSAIASCAELAALGKGREVHAEAVKSGARSSPAVVTALVTMYSKCGCLEDSERAFEESDRRSRPDSVLWSSMISAYGLHGRGKEAVELFEEMDRRGLTERDGVTFLSLLRACSHCGMGEKGLEIFETMVTKYGLRPRLEHYNCLVDLLGRSGQLEEAEAVVRAMPMPPDSVVWKTLLSACGRHKNADVARRVAGEVMGLGTGDPALRVLASNVYASAGLWGEAEAVREALRGERSRREPGTSWLEITAEW